jgi:hypothetical protein
MPPDTTGQVPAYFVNETDQLGAAVAASFSPASAQARVVDQAVACGAGAAALALPPPPGGFAFDAVILEEDLARGNQRIAGYVLQTCSAPGGACAEAQWVNLTGAGQTEVLGVTVGRRVIERGFGGANGLTINATGLRFRCTASFPAGAGAFLRSFSAHKMVPPRGWPAPPFNCSVFGCTCRGEADYYGIGARGASAWGCAPEAAQKWWINDATPCEQPGYSCCAASVRVRRRRWGGRWGGGLLLRPVAAPLRRGGHGGGARRRGGRFAVPRRRGGRRRRLLLHKRVEHRLLDGVQRTGQEHTQT